MYCSLHVGYSYGEAERLPVDLKQRTVNACNSRMRFGAAVVNIQVDCAVWHGKISCDKDSVNVYRTSSQLPVLESLPEPITQPVDLFTHIFFFKIWSLRRNWLKRPQEWRGRVTRKRKKVNFQRNNQLLRLETITDQLFPVMQSA